ncbi:MAG: multiprotein bridging factor aMBF1 [Methanomicrobiales archaeon]|nr:multiprotein bridging factor aMBF1 [Methanomicrobiales archaeon]
MQCELCGADIRGIPKLVQIEGAQLQVCIQCAKYGTEVTVPKKVPAGRKGVSQPVSPPKRPRRDVFDFMGADVIDDYGTQIRKARMNRGWDQKTLAREIKEREILIKKIEKGDLIPEDEVRKKLERALEISLVETPTEEEGKKPQGKVTTTFGDLISIRKEKK